MSIKSYRISRSSGYGCECLAELPEVPGTVARAYRTFKSSGRYKYDVPVPRVFVAPAYRSSRSSGYGYERPTEVTEVQCRVRPGVITPGMVMCALPTERKNKVQARVWMSCSTYRPSEYGCGFTETTEVPGTGSSRLNTRLKRGEKQQIDWSKKYTIANPFPIHVNYYLLFDCNTDHAIAYPGYGA